MNEKRQAELLALRRNDVEAAVEYFKRHAVDGRLPPDEARILIGLQDDPTALEDRFEQLAT